MAVVTNIGSGETVHHQSEVLLLQIQVSRVISQLSDGGRDGLSTWTLTCFKATNRPVLNTGSATNVVVVQAGAAHTWRI